MRIAIVAAAMVVGMSVPSHAQETSAPLFVSATVVSTCMVVTPRLVEASHFSTMTVEITCARRGSLGRTPRIERPRAPKQNVEGAVLVINF
jgi:hypothetical protein